MGIKCIRTQQVATPEQPLFLYQNMIQVKKNTDPRSEYEFLQKIGKGSFSVVYRIRNKLTGNLRAMKQIEKKRNPRLQKQIMNQFSILRELDHPNIMKMYEYFEDNNFIYIVAELCPGKEFFEYIVESKYIKQAKARSIFYELVCSVSYMHEHHIMHRDLKPENILYDSAKGVLKVVDLGSALQFDSSEISERKRVGTSYYIAPEVLLRNYNQKCDVWSLGVILYIMLSGEPPFKGSTDIEILERVKSGSLEFKKSIWGTISEAGKQLLRGVLQRDVKKRLSLSQILEHQWFSVFLEEREKSLLSQQQQKNMINCLSNIKSFKDLKSQSLQEGIITFIVNFVRSNEDASQLQHSFKTLDLNGDGVLSQDELTLGMMKFLKTTKREASVIAEAVFKKADKNRSGFIDYSQFVVAASNFELNVSAQNLDVAFNYLDTDGSGKISANELKDQLGSNIPEENYHQMLKKFDVNSDGEISREEFREMMKKMLQLS